MNTHYSVVFASVNSIITERLSIGLVLVDGPNSWFRYSKSKLTLMRQFFSEEAFHLLKTTLKNMESTAPASSGQNRTRTDKVLFDANDQNQDPFSVEYLRYLSRYSNATVTFNEPVKIDVEASDSLFEHLFREFIFEETDDIPKKSVVETVKETLYPTIKKHVNWNQRIETGVIPGLIVPVELDFIGKNENPVTGKVADFNIHNTHLDASLAKYLLLTHALNANKLTGCNFIIADEPTKLYPKQHKIWSEIYNSKDIKLVPISEIDQITVYMEKHGVQPYFELEQVE